MPDSGKGGRPVESSGVKAFVGWEKAQSDPPGRQGAENWELVHPVIRFRRSLLYGRSNDSGRVLGYSEIIVGPDLPGQALDAAD
jgi:hypothetical protein